MNEELTADEGKRRFGKEREKAILYKMQLEKAEAELNRWRSGESVSQEEQVNLRDAMDVTIGNVDFIPADPIVPILPTVPAAPAVRADCGTEVPHRQAHLGQ